MKSSIEQFEDWWAIYADKCAHPVEDVEYYAAKDAWQASRAAIVVSLPDKEEPANFFCEIYDCYKVQEALSAHGIKVEGEVMSNEVQEMEVAILIGGPSDGQRINIGRGVDEIRIASGSGYQVKIHEYRRTSFHILDQGKIGDFSLFTHSSIPCNSIMAIQALIEGYRKPLKDDNDCFFDFKYDIGQLDGI